MGAKRKSSLSKKNFELPVLNLNAAGIDIGSEKHFVAVPADRDEQPVRSFDTFTHDLHELAKWLKKCNIDTIAMESTGVYWISLFQILESYDFEVILVNAQHVKNVPGRKSDVKDCQWLQKLHTYGLLRGSFQPEDDIRALRTYLRQRDTLVKYVSSHVQHIQKSLTLMNIKLHNVISDITGKTGMNIIREIIKGERNPEILVNYCVGRLKNPKEIIKKSLEGNYSEDNVFTLKQAVEFYDFYHEKIEEIESQIQLLLKTFQTNTSIEDKKYSEGKSKKKIKNPEIRDQLVKITGVDLTQINGLNTLSVLVLISETGFDMSKWKSEKHFSSWLGLAPNNKITGGKVISSKTKKVKSRANNTLRLSAQNLMRSESYLGGYYRRKRAGIGVQKAIVATAHKIAVIYYNMLKYGNEFYDYGCEYYDTKYREQQIKYLKKKAKNLGFQLSEVSC